MLLYINYARLSHGNHRRLLTPFTNGDIATKLMR